MFLIFAALSNSGIKKKHFICTLTNQEEPTDDENGKVEDSVVTKIEAVADQEKKSATQVKLKADYLNEAGLPKKGKANTPKYDIGLHYKDIHKMCEKQLYDLV